MSVGNMQRCIAALVAAACGCTTAPVLACATCGCTADSDAAMGYSSQAGWRVNLEYAYINQDALRTGTRAATPEQGYGM